jgi:low affinity Fe/Cu permease
VRKTDDKQPGPAERMTQGLTRRVGSVYAFAAAVLGVLAWTAGGLAFGFTDTWLLAINTVATVTTFLMVFLLQRSQNKDTLAIQLKLNEVVAALEGASNRLIYAEALPEAELRRLHDLYEKMAKNAHAAEEMTAAATVEDHHDPSGKARPDAARSAP